MNKKWELSQNRIYYNSILKSWITTTTKGGLLQINLSGRTFKNTFEDVGEDHHFEYLNGGALTVNESEVSFKSENQSFYFDLPEGVNQVETIELPHGTFYTFVDRRTEKVYLLDFGGNSVNGFPVYGSTIPLVKDIDQDGNHNLLTISSDGVLLNYAVE